MSLGNIASSFSIDLAKAKITNLLKQAKAYANKGVVALDKLRLAVDSSEAVVSNELWPLANYQELLLVL